MKPVKYQQELKQTLSTLEPWQRQWIACRAAMRILPAIGAVGDFRFWDDAETSVAAIARLPWLVSLSHLISVDFSADQATVKRASSFSSSFSPPVFTTIAAHATSATSAAAATYDASVSGDEGLSAIATCIRAINEGADAAAGAAVNAVSHTAFTVSVKAIALADANWFASTTHPGKARCNKDVWQAFFGRVLWEPAAPWSDGWDAANGSFHKTLYQTGLSELGDQYSVHCHEGANFEDIQKWMFGEVRVPRHDDDSLKLPEGEAWWMQLLYRIGLEDRGRLNLLVQPKADDVESALMDCIRRSEQGVARAKDSSKVPADADSEIESGVLEVAVGRWPKRTEILGIAERLENQFDHLSPPPLWTAWFQMVHGEELRKIRERFAKEPH